MMAIMAEDRALLFCMALFAACSGHKMFVGHLVLRSSGERIGEAYALDRNTIRIERFNFDPRGADMDLVWMFGHTTTPDGIGVEATFSLLQNRAARSPQSGTLPGLVFKNATLNVNVPHTMDRCGERRFDLMKIVDRTSGNDLAKLVNMTKTTDDKSDVMCLNLTQSSSSSSSTSSSAVPSPTATSTAVTTSPPPAATSTAATTTSQPPAATSTAATTTSPPPTATSTAATTTSPPPAATSTAATTTSPPPTATSTAATTTSQPPAATSTEAITTSPPTTLVPKMYYNCSKLSTGYGLCWSTQKRKTLKFMLCAEGIGPGKYMAFGWSRNLKKTSMYKADAAVCTHHINDTWNVDDYYLRSRKTCRTNRRGQTVGVCHDIAYSGGRDHLRNASAYHENGVGYCTFTRRLYSSARHDVRIKLKQNQAIVWAVGPVATDGRIQKHSRHAGAETELISFGRGGQRCELSNPQLCCKSIIQEQREEQ